jgi:hypothetical protein
MEFINSQTSILEERVMFARDMTEDKKAIDDAKVDTKSCTLNNKIINHKSCFINKSIPKFQSVPITTKVVSLNPSQGKVSSIQLYVIKFVSNLQHHTLK